jgi:hypothetical protein
MEQYKGKLGRWGGYNSDTITIRKTGLYFFESFADFKKIDVFLDKENSLVIFKKSATGYSIHSSGKAAIFLTDKIEPGAYSGKIVDDEIHVKVVFK